MARELPLADAAKQAHPAQSPGDLSDPAFVQYLFYYLLLTRAVEQRCILNVRQGLQAKFFSAWGNEATSVGSAAALAPDDVLVPMHRSLGAHLLRGHSVREIFLQVLLREGSQTRGRDTGIHLGAPGTNILGMISPLGSMNVVAAGVALGEQYLQRDHVVLTYIGDGGSSTGVFHEAMNFIGARKLPVVTIIENNQWAFGTPTSLQFGCKQLADRGAGYGMPGLQIDGTDLCAVYEATRAAVERARAGEGPTLIESMTMRMRGHAEHDDVAYVDKEQLEAWAQKDPVERLERWIREGNRVPGLDIEGLKAEIEAKVLAASDWARAQPEPDPQFAAQGVFFESASQRQRPETGSTVRAQPPAEATRALATERAKQQHTPPPEGSVPAAGSTVTYIQAIRECLRSRMREDARLLLIGEDIGLMGGAFRATEGLLNEFGDGRVIDTPIAEGAITGACIGLAVRGFRPVAEMQFADFVASTFNELVNNAGTYRYRIGVGVPMVMRLPAAGGIGAGPFHSLNPEAWFAHAAGLKIVVPSTVEDAYGLLNAAIDDEDPVLYLEQKYFYRRLKAPLPSPGYRVALGTARTARTGKDATVVTWGIGVERALEAAKRLSDAQVGEVEVIDLRSIVPWDQGAVAASVRKTNRLLVLHEARLTCGFGAEIGAWVAQECFSWLDAPVQRLAAQDVPIPSHKGLERAVTPQVEDVVEALEGLCRW